MVQRALFYHEGAFDMIVKMKRSPQASARFSLGVEIKWADAGRDSRTYLARPFFSGANGARGKLNFPCSSRQARTETGEIIFSCSADHKQD